MHKKKYKLTVTPEVHNLDCKKKKKLNQFKIFCKYFHINIINFYVKLVEVIPHIILSFVISFKNNVNLYIVGTYLVPTEVVITEEFIRIYITFN